MVPLYYMFLDRFRKFLFQEDSGASFDPICFVPRFVPSLSFREHENFSPP